MNKIGIPNLDSQLEQSLITDLKKVEDLMRSHIKGDYPLVVETSRHLVEAGGKRLRPLLTLLSAQFGDSTNYDIIKAAVCCELTHLATLYHDDVMDDAALRRGVISANKKWDNAVAILTGDYLFSKVSDMLADIGPEAVKLQAKTFERLVIGQIKETQGKSEGEKIGVAFQVADDLLDIASNETASGKTPGTDLKEGVPTLVTLFVMADNDPADKVLIEKLSKPISDQDLVGVIQELRNHKALKRVQEYLSNVAKEANQLLVDLPNGPAKSALENLTFALVNRST